jgi:hypothetical protein
MSQRTAQAQEAFWFKLRPILRFWGLQRCSALAKVRKKNQIGWLCGRSVYQNANTRLSLNCGYNWLHLLRSTATDTEQPKTYVCVHRYFCTFHHTEDQTLSQRQMTWHSVCQKQYTNRRLATSQQDTILSVLLTSPHFCSAASPHTPAPVSTGTASPAEALVLSRNRKSKRE